MGHQTKFEFSLEQKNNFQIFPFLFCVFFSFVIFFFLKKISAGRYSFLIFEKNCSFNILSILNYVLHDLLFPFPRKPKFNFYIIKTDFLCIFLRKKVIWELRQHLRVFALLLVPHSSPKVVKTRATLRFYFNSSPLF